MLCCCAEEQTVQDRAETSFLPHRDFGWETNTPNYPDIRDRNHTFLSLMYFQIVGNISPFWNRNSGLTHSWDSVASTVQKATRTHTVLPASKIYMELLFLFNTSCWFTTTNHSAVFWSLWNTKSLLLLPGENPVCSSLPPAHGCSMGQSPHRRGIDTEHQAELPSSPLLLVWLPSACTSYDSKKGKPILQTPQCKMMMREETSEEMGKNSSTCTSWQIDKYHWENK